MLTRLVEWLIGCSTTVPDPTWSQVLVSAFRCLVRFGLVIALLYAAREIGIGVSNAL